MIPTRGYLRPSGLPMIATIGNHSPPLLSSHSGLLPALGPAHLYGFAIPAMQTAQDLHAGKVGPFLYLGIVSFPSFHTVMAVLFTLAHRNLKWSFPPFLMLNLLMLTSI